MMLIDFLSVLSDADTDLLLAINGWRAEWADYFTPCGDKCTNKP